MQHGDTDCAKHLWQTGMTWLSWQMLVGQSIASNGNSEKNQFIGMQGEQLQTTSAQCRCRRTQIYQFRVHCSLASNCCTLCSLCHPAS